MYIYVCWVDNFKVYICLNVGMYNLSVGQSVVDIKTWKPIVNMHAPMNVHFLHRDILNTTRLI
jgi:hypothetical protein